LGGLSDRCLNIAPADNGSGRHRPPALSGGLFFEVVAEVLVVLLTAEVPEAVVFGFGKQGVGGGLRDLSRRARSAG